MYESFSYDGLIVARGPNAPLPPTPAITRRTADDWQPDLSDAV